MTLGDTVTKMLASTPIPYTTAQLFNVHLLRVMHEIYLFYDDQAQRSSSSNPRLAAEAIEGSNASITAA